MSACIVNRAPLFVSEMGSHMETCNMVEIESCRGHPSAQVSFSSQSDTTTCPRSREVAQPRVTWWRHQMETYSMLLALCEGNSPVTGKLPHKGQWHGALRFLLICARTNGWENHRDAGDLRRHRAHYDVTVMWYEFEIMHSLGNSNTHPTASWLRIILRGWF